jgi:hypothetical protein
VDNFTGAKYNSSLDVAAVAKLFKADVKAAQDKEAVHHMRGGVREQGVQYLPMGLRLSVRIERYAGGCSIHVRVTDLPEGMSNPYTTEYLQWYKAEGFNRHVDTPTRYIPAFAALLSQLEVMLNAYNRDSSDSRSDYFNRKFYESVQIGNDLGKVSNYFALLQGEV